MRVRVQFTVDVDIAAGKASGFFPEEWDASEVRAFLNSEAEEYLVDYIESGVAGT